MTPDRREGNGPVHMRKHNACSGEILAHDLCAERIIVDLQQQQVAPAAIVLVRGTQNLRSLGSVDEALSHKVCAGEPSAVRRLLPVFGACNAIDHGAGERN